MSTEIPEPIEAGPPARHGRKWIVLGLVLLVAGGLVAVLGTYLGMTHSFRLIEEDQASTPDSLKVGVDATKWSFGIGALFGLFGLAFFVVGISQMLNRREEAPAEWGSDSP